MAPLPAMPSRSDNHPDANQMAWNPSSLDSCLELHSSTTSIFKDIHHARPSCLRISQLLFWQPVLDKQAHPRIHFRRGLRSCAPEADGICGLGKPRLHSTVTGYLSARGWISRHVSEGSTRTQPTPWLSLLGESVNATSLLPVTSCGAPLFCVWSLPTEKAPCWQMIHSDSARGEQEGLGKTNLPISFWTEEQQEAYMPKLGKKKKYVFSVRFTFPQLNFQWNMSCKSPLFPLSLQNCFFYFSSYIFSISSLCLL